MVPQNPKRATKVFLENIACSKTYAVPCHSAQKLVSVWCVCACARATLIPVQTREKSWQYCAVSKNPSLLGIINIYLEQSSASPPTSITNYPLHRCKLPTKALAHVSAFICSGTVLGACHPLLLTRVQTVLLFLLEILPSFEPDFNFMVHALCPLTDQSHTEQSTCSICFAWESKSHDQAPKTSLSQDFFG